jgi:hypothetical protein
MTTQTKLTQQVLEGIRFMEGTYEDRLNKLEEYALTLAERLDKRPLPRLSTYTILTGEKYFVEATSEEEALNKFNNDEAEYIETDTQVIGND